MEQKRDETPDMEELCFQMITAAGEAKSDYLEALEAVREGNFPLADQKLQEGGRAFARAHESHGRLVQRESAGHPVQVSLLLCHVEDQIMSVEGVRLMVQEFYELYRRLGPGREEAL